MPDKNKPGWVAITVQWDAGADDATLVQMANELVASLETLLPRPTCDRIAALYAKRTETVAGWSKPMLLWPRRGRFARLLSAVKSFFATLAGRTASPPATGLEVRS